MTKAADSHCGRAPSMARSLTVPCTARCPIEPPGKERGCTTKESVLNASRSPPGSVERGGVGRAAPSASLANASRNTASTSAADALPPAPWASVTISSVQPGPAAAEGLDALEHRRLARRQPAHGHAGRHAVGLERPLHALPEGDAPRRLRLLDAVDAVGAHHEAVVDVARRRPCARRRSRPGRP